MSELKVTIEQVCRRLDERNLGYKVLQLSEEYSIVVTQYGGRILGPFRGSEASILWINKSFEDRTSFNQMIENRGPIGGERLWISPEIQYGVKDRNNFWESLFVPNDVDPGNYRMNVSTLGNIHLEQEMELEAYNIGTGLKSLGLKRSISMSQDPLRHMIEYQSILSDVKFFGYSQSVTLEETKTDDIRSEAWTLAQVNPGGVVLVPTLSPCEITDYYSPAPQGSVNIQPRFLSASITGTDQYKIGMISSNTIGRIAYLNQVDSGEYCLLVRCFQNNPTSSYADEAPDIIGRAGYSMHIYNDDGRFGGFGELETMGQTIGGNGRKSSSTDRSEMWFYRGTLESMKNVGLHLLGLDITQVKY